LTARTGGGAIAPRVGAQPDDDISLLRLANVLLKRWTLVCGLPLGFALAALGVSLALPPSFTATASFVPEANPQSGIPSTLAGVAGQLGLSLGAQTTQSPRFYAAVLRSRQLMERILLARYPKAPQAADSATLLQLLKTGGRDAADSLSRGVKTLDRLLTVTADNQTNIVDLGITARSPLLAAEVANRFLDYLNIFNTQTRESQARERRKFIEGQLGGAQVNLLDAESELKTFYERNRSWRQSPELMFEEGRLRRQVDIRQDVYLTLSREFETARIQEVNDTPVITVIDIAVPPRRKSAPQPIVFSLVGFLLGALVAATWAFGADHFDRLDEEDSKEYSEFRRHIREAQRALSLRGPEISSTRRSATASD